MGADLTIRSIYHYDELKRTFVGDENLGYFRDSYNSTSVLRTLSLSWWKDVIPLLDDEGLLQPEQIKQFKEMILGQEQRLPDREMLESWHAHVEDGTEHAVEHWHTYYREKRERLLAFLNRALELNEPIDCSL